MSPRVANIGRLVAEEIGPVEGARFAYLLVEDEGDVPPTYLRPSPFGPMPFPSGFGPPPRLSSCHAPHHGRQDHDHHHQRQYAGGPGVGTGPRGLPPAFVPRPPNEREFAEIAAAFHCTPRVAARLVREGDIVFATDGRSLYDARLEGRLQQVRRLRVMGRMAG